MNQRCPVIDDREWKVYRKPEVLGYKAPESQMSSMYDDDDDDVDDETIMEMMNIAAASQCVFLHAPTQVFPDKS